MSISGEPIIRVIELKKYFPVSRGLAGYIRSRGSAQYIKAVDGISFDVHQGEVHIGPV